MEKKHILAGLLGAVTAMGADLPKGIGHFVPLGRPPRNPKSVVERIRGVRTLEELNALLAEVARYPDVKGKTLKRWNYEIEAAKKRLTEVR